MHGFITSFILAVVASCAVATLLPDFQMDVAVKRADFEATYVSINYETKAYQDDIDVAEAN